MKTLLGLITMALLTGGCSYKNEALKLQPYEANYKAPISQEKKTVFIKSVQDSRAEKQTVGYAVEGSEKVITFFSHEDFAQKYKDALHYALNTSKFNTDINEKDATLTISVNIKEIELIYSNVSFDEDLSGKIVVELTLKENNTITKHNFTQKEGKWIGPSYNSRDLEPFLSKLFQQSVDTVVVKLVE